MPETAGAVFFALAILAFLCALVLDLMQRPGILAAIAIGLGLLAAGHLVG